MASTIPCLFFGFLKFPAPLLVYYIYNAAHTQTNTGKIYKKTLRDWNLLSVSSWWTQINAGIYSGNSFTSGEPLQSLRGLNAFQKAALVVSHGGGLDFGLFFVCVCASLCACSCVLVLHSFKPRTLGWNCEWTRGSAMVTTASGKKRGKKGATCVVSWGLTRLLLRRLWLQTVKRTE